MFTRRLSVLLQKYPAVFLKNFLSGKCVFQIGPLRRTQMDLCKVWYFCKKPNRTCQVAEEQKEMVTSLKVHQQKNTEDKIRLAVAYCLHASLILRTSSSRKVEGKRKKKPKPKRNNPGVPTLQYIWSAHTFHWHRGFMQHMEYPPWPGHWQETSASCQDWDEWNLMTNREKVQNIDSGFLLPCPVCLQTVVPQSCQCCSC